MKEVFPLKVFPLKVFPLKVFPLKVFPIVVFVMTRVDRDLISFKMEIPGIPLFC